MELFKEEIELFDHDTGKINVNVSQETKNFIKHCLIQ